LSHPGKKKNHQVVFPWNHFNMFSMDTELAALRRQVQAAQLLRRQAQQAYNQAEKARQYAEQQRKQAEKASQDAENQLVKLFYEAEAARERAAQNISMTPTPFFDWG